MQTMRRIRARYASKQNPQVKVDYDIIVDMLFFMYFWNRNQLAWLALGKKIEWGIPLPKGNRFWLLHRDFHILTKEKNNKTLEISPKFYDTLFARERTEWQEMTRCLSNKCGLVKRPRGCRTWDETATKKHLMLLGPKFQHTEMDRIEKICKGVHAENINCRSSWRWYNKINLHVITLHNNLLF